MGKEPYYNVRSDYMRHPKIRELRELHGANGVVALQTLWGYAAQGVPNGVFEGASAEDICKFCGWSLGQDFVDDLVAIHLLDRLESGGFSIHNWLKYQPHLKK